nr:hypothetical protein [Solirubrobacterales bacterium]
MATTGDELVNPATGLRTVFRETAEDSDGELLQVEWIGDRGWTTGPDHVHPMQEERFEVSPARSAYGSTASSASTKPAKRTSPARARRTPPGTPAQID